MKIIAFIYCLGRFIVEGFVEIIMFRHCRFCKGSNGHCDECKYNPNSDGKKNIFKRDWDKTYAYFLDL